MGKTKFMEFVKEMKAECESRLGEGHGINIVRMDKNNGQVWTGLAITTDNPAVDIAIYLDPVYEAYQNGTEKAQIVADIIRMYGENKALQKKDIFYLKDYRQAAPYIHASLVNYKDNAGRLCGMPHRKFLDLAVVYYIDVELPGKQGSVGIRNGCMALWGVDEADLYRQAMENMKQEALVMNLCDMITGFLPEGEARLQEPAPKMFVLTNKKMWHGAAMVLQTENLDNVCLQAQTERLIIIPSSIHESILIPYGEDMEHGLSEMISQINENWVETTEVLGGHPYIYDKKTKKVSISDGI